MMKPNSTLFDRIRIRPDESGAEAPKERVCDYEGCAAEGLYRAPKGRGREGEFYQFCLDHVREYNKGYNYFAGMSSAETVAWQKTSATGHRPTWTVGSNAWSPNGRRRIFAGERAQFRVDDGLGLFAEEAQQPRPAPRRALRPLERRALETLGLDEGATGADIKARYKELVKRHHPDANGGDRTLEGRLREVIQAYKQLRAAGLC
jgi:hypothetical protein